MFLDTQQWNYLVATVDATDAETAYWRSRLVEQVNDLRVEVIGSLPLMQEVTRAYRSSPEKYQTMRTLLLDCVGNRWLLPLGERHRKEAQIGGTLSYRDRYLSRTHRRELIRMSKRLDGLRWIDDTTYAETANFKTEQERLRIQVGPKLAAATGEPDVRLVMDEWWAGVDVNDWVSEVVDEGVRRRLITRPPDVGLRTAFPSVWLFTAFKLARMKLNVGEGRAIKASDYMDAEHCALGEYIDVLITDDRAFRKTLQMLPTLPFKLETFKDLVRRLTD